MTYRTLIESALPGIAALELLRDQLARQFVDGNQVRPGDVILWGDSVYSICRVETRPPGGGAGNLIYHTHTGVALTGMWPGEPVPIVPRSALRAPPTDHCVCGIRLTPEPPRGDGTT